MKKPLFLTVFVFMVTFSAFSQQPRNAPFINFGPLMTGMFNSGFGLTLGFEAVPLRYLSIVNSVTFLQYSVDADNTVTDILTFAYTLEERLYPMTGLLDKLFIGIGFNYTFMSGEVNEWGNGSIFGALFESGWKFVFPLNVFAEVALGYKLKFSPDIEISKYAAKPNWLEIGLSCGWVF